MNTIIKGKIYELANQIAEDGALELVNVDMLAMGKKTLLRVVVDKERGVTIGDCERTSRGLEALLDAEELIKGTYLLEVSSPGLDRPLIKQKDFEKNRGKLARVITTEKIVNQTFLIGRIVDVGEDWVRLRLRKKEKSEDIFIPIDKISKARLEIEPR